MIVSDAFRGKRYAVLGLARSGLATVAALTASGAKVTAWDSNEEARKIFLPQRGRGTMRSMVEGQGAERGARPLPLHPPSGGPPPRSGEELVLADPLEIDLAGFDGVVVSPGVPLNRHPIAAKARAAGVPVIGDIELFAQARAGLPTHKVVGITGTNGKSTTTALIHHILKTAGVPTTMGGNIGLPILAQEPLEEGGVYVLELSSYQIDLTNSLDCEVAVLLNITPDHLDRYDGFEGYVASKARLFAMQSESHTAVLSDGPGIVEFDACSSGNIIRAHTAYEDSGAAVVMGEASWDYETFADQKDWPALQGPHNAENAACAIAACRSLGIELPVIAEGLRTYPGLPHRMERVATKNGVLYVNDSKATNPTSTAPALAAFPDIYWIVGGMRKSDDLDACMPYLNNVRAAYTIGDATDLFADILHNAGKIVTHSWTLERAVRAAALAARPGETVLLSPACASFDQFSDFEARGEAFRVAVEGLR